LLLATGVEPPVDLLGYSLGARFALHAALTSPDSVARLVLIGGTAGIENDDARAERRRRDEEMAAELEAQDSVDAFVEGWLRNPMFATLRADAAGTEERRANTPAGLASSLRLAGAGVQAPLWDRLGELTMPVLVIAGATDDRYQALGRRLARAVPHGILAVIPGAGHAAHLEQPRLTAAVVDAWLAGAASHAD
jgi:2-succinyl-6-hydroxy-2,4-cyclohexadiene-1-carboxylate synthase